MEKVNELVALFQEALSKISDYKSRMNCSKFWWSVLSVLIVSVIGSLIMALVGKIPVIGGLVSFVWNIFIALLYSSLAARRLNDVAGPSFLAVIWLILNVAALLLGTLTSWLTKSFIGAIFGVISGVIGGIVAVASLVVAVIIIIYCVKPSATM